MHFYAAPTAPSPSRNTRESVRAFLVNFRKNYCRFMAVAKKFCSSWFGKNNSKVIMLHFLFDTIIFS